MWLTIVTLSYVAREPARSCCTADVRYHIPKGLIRTYGPYQEDRSRGTVNFASSELHRRQPTDPRPLCSSGNLWGSRMTTARILTVTAIGALALGLSAGCGGGTSPGTAPTAVTVTVTLPTTVRMTSTVTTSVQVPTTVTAFATQTVLATVTEAAASAAPPAADTPTPEPAAPTTAAPAPAPAAAYYANCTEARAAGVTPLHRGDPGYASKLDRDGDGVACE